MDRDDWITVATILGPGTLAQLRAAGYDIARSADLEQWALWTRRRDRTLQELERLQTLLMAWQDTSLPPR